MVPPVSVKSSVICHKKSRLTAILIKQNVPTRPVSSVFFESGKSEIIDALFARLRFRRPQS